MIRALRHLTLRGRCLLAAGLAALVSGVSLREQDLLRVAVLLLALPLVSVALATRTRFRLTCARRIEPPRTAAGDPAQVVLRLENVSRLPTGLLLVEDTIPFALGGRPRLVLDRLPPHHPVDVSYRVTGEVRGRYAVGPLRIRMMDPFGLCEVARSFTTVDTLVVTPHVVALPPVRLTGEWAGSGSSTARAVATAGEDDAATREYHQGDDLRRIHWRSTARRGELMVRREEQPWQSRGALLVDTRAGAHQGVGPTSSFEWVVSAAASIGIHLSHAGFDVRLVSDAGDELSPAGMAGATFDGALLDSLATLTPSRVTNLHAGAAAMRRQGGEGLLVALVGSLSLSDAEQLARLRSGGASVGVAFMVDGRSWATLAPAAARAAAAADEAARALLRRAGWRTFAVTREDSLVQLWQQAGQAVTATASRLDEAAPVGALGAPR